MNNGPLWSQDPQGNYWLCFRNRHALLKEDIKDIFSQYGTVKMVTESGDEKGFRFVQFATLEDVRNAADNLTNHPKIDFMPYRPKNKNNQNNNVKREENTEIDSEKRNFFQRKTVNNYHRISLNGARLSIDSNTTDLQNAEYESNYDKASTCSSNTSHSRLNGFSPNNIYSNKSQKAHETSPACSPKTSINPDNKLKKLLDSRGVYCNSFNTGPTSNSGNFDYNYEDELPDLVASNKIKSQTGAKKIIYNADEVIVANIPNDYGSAYVLHLFEDFEPLAISYIKIAPKTHIRYCHVYFKSVEDSLGAETMFDKSDLGGKRLVVLRSCNLEEEVLH